MGDLAKYVGGVPIGSYIESAFDPSSFAGEYLPCNGQDAAASAVSSTFLTGHPEPVFIAVTRTAAAKFSAGAVVGGASWFYGGATAGVTGIQYAASGTTDWTVSGVVLPSASCEVQQLVYQSGATSPRVVGSVTGCTMPIVTSGDRPDGFKACSAGTACTLPNALAYFSAATGTFLVPSGATNVAMYLPDAGSSITFTAETRASSATSLGCVNTGTTLLVFTSTEGLIQKRTAGGVWSDYYCPNWRGIQTPLLLASDLNGTVVAVVKGTTASPFFFFVTDDHGMIFQRIWPPPEAFLNASDVFADNVSIQSLRYVGGYFVMTMSTGLLISKTGKHWWCEPATSRGTARIVTHGIAVIGSRWVVVSSAVASAYSMSIDATLTRIPAQVRGGPSNGAVPNVALQMPLWIKVK